MINAQVKKIAVIMVVTGMMLSPSFVQAEISVSLSLDRREASMDDSVRMSISIAGTRSSDVDPVIGGLEAFHVSDGGTSSRVQIVNGSVDATVEHTYYLRPKKTGTLRIGPAQVVVDGKPHTSNTATLRVGAGERSSGQGSGPLFLIAQVSSPKAYVEEQVIYTLKLCRRARVSDLALELPKGQNLVIKKLGDPSEYQSIFDDLTYQVLELRYAIMAAKEGVYALAPARMSMTVHEPRDRSRRRFMDDPFFNDPFFSFSRGTSTTIASQPLELEVVPLPSEGRPSDFSGLVGQFRITSQLAPVEVKKGDSTTLTVQLKGEGNVSRMPDLVFPNRANIKNYSDQPVVESGAGENRLFGSKTMKWALVPEQQGTYEIPPLAVSFYDPSAGQYKVIKTSPALLSVIPGAQSQTVGTSAGIRDNGDVLKKKQEIEVLGGDILPVHTSFADLAAGFSKRPTGLIYWAIFIVPPGLLGLVFCGKRLQRKTEADRSLVKAKRAVKTFLKVCRKRGLSNEDMAQAVRGYVNDRFGLDYGSITPSEAFEMLVSTGVQSDWAQKVEELLQHMDNAIYTGKGNTPCQSGEDMAALITRIERELR